jgi:hypothetical protein
MQTGVVVACPRGHVYRSDDTRHARRESAVMAQGFTGHVPVPASECRVCVATAPILRYDDID